MDGVLSNGFIYLTNQGDEIKSFHVHDGLGIKLLMHAGIEVAVITTSANHIIETRMGQLGIRYYFSGYRNKINAYHMLKQQLNLADHQFAYVGDDLPDLKVMEQVGFSVAVADAAEEIKQCAHYITCHPGGKGAIREVSNLILRSNNLLETALTRYIADA